MTTYSSKFDCLCFVWGILGIKGHVVGQQYLKYMWVDNNMSGLAQKSHRISSRYNVCIHSLMHNIKLHLKQHGCKYFVGFVVGVTSNFVFLSSYTLCKLQKTTPICSLIARVSIWIYNCYIFCSNFYHII